jgi:hypothetical protein
MPEEVKTPEFVESFYSSDWSAHLCLFSDGTVFQSTLDRGLMRIRMTADEFRAALKGELKGYEPCPKK